MQYNIKYFLVIASTMIIVGFMMIPDLIIIFQNKSNISSGVNQNTENFVAAEIGRGTSVGNEHETSKNDVVDVNSTKISRDPLPAVPSYFPSMPSGWSWLYLKEIETGIAIPDNWHWKELDSSDVPILLFPQERRREIRGPIVSTFLITKNPIDHKGSFKTGLTLFVIQDMYNRMGVNPYDYARAYIQSAFGKGQVEETWEQSLGPFYERGFKARNFLSYGEQTITHHSLLINSKNGTIYLVIFKSPSSMWEEAWKIGYTMVYSSIYSKTI